MFIKTITHLFTRQYKILNKNMTLQTEDDLHNPGIPQNQHYKAKKKYNKSENPNCKDFSANPNKGFFCTKKSLQYSSASFPSARFSQFTTISTYCKLPLWSHQRLQTPSSPSSYVGQ